MSAMLNTMGWVRIFFRISRDEFFFSESNCVSVPCGIRRTRLGGGIANDGDGHEHHDEQQNRRNEEVKLRIVGKEPLHDERRHAVGQKQSENEEAENASERSALGEVEPVGVNLDDGDAEKLWKYMLMRRAATFS
jgi:hypothetical protein